ncbi:hypothetical protein GWI33_011773 [Rhynchophorus ferrugineus]|uniref:Uncharacterized protein n=1 Tax=Rhynchophorus ferrugineus TaxID=354439 RepID=A0A834I6G2_RHYFE|nr:hypothetical protein GWI33_011773 [Rhynchophorus ferrugineus]
MINQTSEHGRMALRRLGAGAGGPDLHSLTPRDVAAFMACGGLFFVAINKREQGHAELGPRNHVFIDDSFFKTVARRRIPSHLPPLSLLTLPPDLYGFISFFMAAIA